MKKFTENQVFTNFLKTHPRQKFDLYSGSLYINDRVSQGEQVQSGNLSLYEMNVNRGDGDEIYPFITKDGAKNSFTVTSTSAYSALLFGDTIDGTYPLTSSIERRKVVQSVASPDAQLRALKNTLNYYKKLSQHFDFDTYYSGSTDVTLVSIPSIFFDAGIKRGSVKLKFYFTGSLMGEAADTRQNGLLIETTGSSPGSVVGTVLYNEGFLLLTASYKINTDNVDTYENDSPAVNPEWLNWGSYGGTTLVPSASSYVLEFKGTNTIPVFTMFAEAGKNEFNFSNNPTFLSQSSRQGAIVSSTQFVENSGNIVHNIVTSSFENYDEPFHPVTYISKIGIYDKNQKLLGIANLANPVKKTEDVGYTFRITMDI